MFAFLPEHYWKGINFNAEDKQAWEYMSKVFVDFAITGKVPILVKNDSQLKPFQEEDDKTMNNIKFLRIGDQVVVDGKNEENTETRWNIKGKFF